jgi:hypothetical protein
LRPKIPASTKLPFSIFIKERFLKRAGDSKAKIAEPLEGSRKMKITPQGRLQQNGKCSSGNDLP